MTQKLQDEEMNELKVEAVLGEDGWGVEMVEERKRHLSHQSELVTTSLL